MNIDMNEVKNQHVHVLWALIATQILANLGWRFLPTGLIIGLIVEAYQLIFKKEGWKIKDRILDLTFWLVGSMVGLLLIR
jgi:hypothetical protein